MAEAYGTRTHTHTHCRYTEGKVFGFTRTTLLAAGRLRPVPPAMVDMRKTVLSRSPQKRAMLSARAASVMPPSNLQNPTCLILMALLSPTCLVPSRPDPAPPKGLGADLSTILHTALFHSGVSCLA